MTPEERATAAWESWRDSDYRMSSNEAFMEHVTAAIREAEVAARERCALWHDSEAGNYTPGA